MTELALTTLGPSTIAQPSPSRDPYHAYLLTLRGESRRTMRGCLDRTAKLLAPYLRIEAAGPDFPWHALRYEHTLAARELYDRQDWQPATINKHLSALRGVLKQAWLLNLMTSDDYLRAREVRNAEGERLPPGRNLAQREITMMLAACQDGTLAGKRDAAVIAAAQSTGARRAELASTKRRHYAPGDRALRIIGKRNKERLVFVHEVAAEYLGIWLEATEEVEGPLFCPIGKSGKLRPVHMSGDAIGDIIDRRRRQAMLPHLTAHDFRRTFVGDLLNARVDLATAQQLAGHAQASTTARYDRRGDETRKHAVDKLTLPRPDELPVLPDRTTPRPS